MTYDSTIRLLKYVVIFILLIKATTNFVTKLCPIKKLLKKIWIFYKHITWIKKEDDIVNIFQFKINLVTYLYYFNSIS